VGEESIARPARRRGAVSGRVGHAGGRRRAAGRRRVGRVRDAGSPSRSGGAGLRRESRCGAGPAFISRPPPNICFQATAQARRSHPPERGFLDSVGRAAERGAPRLKPVRWTAARVNSRKVRREGRENIIARSTATIMNATTVSARAGLIPHDESAANHFLKLDTVDG